MGATRKPGTGPNPDYPSASPSGLIRPGKKVMEPLTVAEIDKIIRAFTEAAVNAQQLGFDALELHGASRLPDR